MEIAIIFIICAVCLSFILKLSFMHPVAAICESALVALATVLFTDFATGQSKTGIDAWIASPETMLDVAVILTIDVAMQISFCIAMVRNGKLLKEKIGRNILMYFPGLLIFPVMAACLVETIFSNAGTDFYTISYSLGASILVGFPLLAWGVKKLMPGRAMRLELTFYTNCIIALLGVIVTVNGQTAVDGINNANLSALGAIVALFIIGAVAGIIMHKRKNIKI